MPIEMPIGSDIPRCRPFFYSATSAAWTLLIGRPGCSSPAGACAQFENDRMPLDSRTLGSRQWVASLIGKFASMLTMGIMDLRLLRGKRWQQMPIRRLDG